MHFRRKLSLNCSQSLLKDALKAQLLRYIPGEYIKDDSFALYRAVRENIHLAKSYYRLVGEIHGTDGNMVISYVTYPPFGYFLAFVIFLVVAFAGIVYSLSAGISLIKCLFFILVFCLPVIGYIQYSISQCASKFEESILSFVKKSLNGKTD